MAKEETTMGIIVIHIDSQKDTNFLTKCYEGIEDAKVLVNPTRAEIDKVLEDNPTDKVMMLGHGSGSGLFGTNWKGSAIDHKNAKLLKDRECIGIWCYAKNFARTYGLKGYFTSMFISNEGEAKCFGYKNVTEQEVFDEVAIFAERINALIKADVPLNEWVEKLQEQADYSKPFVEYNYSAMEYFDGTQKPYENTAKKTYGYWFDEDYETDFNRGYTARFVDYDIDDEIDLWFDDYCKNNNIVSKDERDVAYTLFKAGWDARGDAETYMF